MLPTLSQIKLYLMLGAAAILAAGSFTMGLKWDAAAIQREKVANLEANAKAIGAGVALQHEYDKAAIAAGKKEAAAQAARAATLSRQLAQVKKHVSDTRTRVPYGVVRLLDSAAGGVLADALPLPTGKSDGALTSLGWDDLARAVGTNYATCRANAGQLDGLTENIRQFQAERQ